LEGFVKNIYKGKTILYYNLSFLPPGTDQKEKIVALLECGDIEWLKQPPNSVLALFNVTNFTFDMNLLNYVKESAKKTVFYEKKIAFVGVTGLTKTAYDLVIGLFPNQKWELFDTEEEAKEWLVQEE
jgi:hypothetical protein